MTPTDQLGILYYDLHFSFGQLIILFQVNLIFVKLMYICY